MACTCVEHWDQGGLPDTISTSESDNNNNNRYINGEAKLDQTNGLVCLQRSA
jgi:hypothetical protein